MVNAELSRQKAIKETAQLAAILELAKNPVVELAAGSLFLSWLTAPRASDDFFQGMYRGFSAPALHAALIAIIVAQQLAPALPYIPDKISSLLPALPSGG